MYYLIVLETRSPTSRCQLGWVLLRDVREGSVPGVSAWFADGHLLPISLHINFSLGVSMAVSTFPLLIKTVLILD